MKFQLQQIYKKLNCLIYRELHKHTAHLGFENIRQLVKPNFYWIGKLLKEFRSTYTFFIRKRFIRK